MKEAEKAMSPSEFLRNVRRKNKENQLTVAKRGGYTSQVSISAIEIGRISISLSKKQKIAKAYALTPKEREEFFSLVDATDPVKGSRVMPRANDVPLKLLALDQLSRLSKEDRAWVLAALSGIESAEKVQDRE